jgi:hypothetical protein
MKHILWILITLFTQRVFGQISKSLKNKWGFLGNGIIFFTEKNDSLSVDIMEQNTYRFIDIYTTGKTEYRNFSSPIQIIDTSTLYKLTAALKLNMFGTKPDTLQFWLDKKKTNKLNISGSIVYGHHQKYIKTNKSCDTISLSCSVILYDISKFEKIKKLKPIETITKKEMELFINRLEKVFKTKCNLCSEPFFVSEINKIVIELGYNPVYSYDEAGQTIYKTSALYELVFLLTMNNKVLKKRYDDIIEHFYTGNK